MTEEWVLFWYQCLSENSTYSQYSSAFERCDTSVCATLSEAFPLLPDLYDDFGSLFGWPRDGINGKDWKAWFLPRRHLFMHVVEQIMPNSEVSQNDGYVQLRIPLQKTAKETSVLVSEYLNQMYSSHTPRRAPTPKYTLHLRGNRVACGYEQVRQAVHTSTVSYAIDPNGNYVPTIRQVVVNFLRGELDNMGWKMSTKARAELMQVDGDLDEDTYEKFRVRVNKCRRDFIALSQNALHGRFPDTSPSPDSDVIDQFWGE